MKRIILLVVAVLIAILIIIGIIMSITHTGLFADPSDTTATIGTPASSPAQNPPVDKSDQGTPSTSSTDTKPSSASGQTPATIPSTGPSDTALVLVTAAALGAMTYSGVRLAQVRVRK